MGVGKLNRRPHDLKILYIVSELSYGGAQKQLVELARAMVRRGHQATIYTLNADVPRLAELDGSGVEVIVDQKRTKLDLALLLRLRRVLLNRRPDIVHGFLFDGDFYARLAAAFTDIPVINSERSHNYALSRTQKIPHFLTRHLARAVVANTFAGKAFAESLFQFSSDKVHVVWNGLHLAEVDQLAASPLQSLKTEMFQSDRVKVACLVGAIKPAKDYLLALDVAAELIRQDDAWRVLFLGEPLNPVAAYQGNANTDTANYKNQVTAKYQKLNLTDKVKFMGMRTDVLQIVRQCDVLFSTSTHEGFPNVVLEAMAVGTPVASVGYSDIRRILPFAWQIADERSALSMALAIQKVYAQRETVAARQRQWVEANATIEHAAASLEAIYFQYVRARLQVALR